jgi:hypothetical protein
MYEPQADSMAETSDAQFFDSQDVHDDSSAVGFLQLGTPEPPEPPHPAVTARATAAAKVHPIT